MTSDENLLTIFATLLAAVASFVSIIVDLISVEDIYYSFAIFIIAFVVLWSGGRIVINELKHDSFYRRLLDREVIPRRKYAPLLIQHLHPNRKTLKLTLYEEISNDRKVITKYPPQFEEKAIERMLIKYQQILVQYGIEMDSRKISQLRVILCEEWEDKRS